MDSLGPSCLLRRAENVLSTAGQAALKEFQPVLNEDAPIMESPVSLNRLRASIRKRFRRGKKEELGLSRSLTTAAGSSSGKLHRRSSHSMAAKKRLQVGGSAVTRPFRSFSESVALQAVQQTLDQQDWPGDDEGEEEEVSVPPALLNGTKMTKVSNKKHKTVVFRLDPDLGSIIWEGSGRRERTIPLETIKELRTGSTARQLSRLDLPNRHLSEEYWLTVVHIVCGAFKTLHLVAPSMHTFSAWEGTLRRLCAVRQRLMNGLGEGRLWETIWDRRWWKAEARMMGQDGVVSGDRKEWVAKEMLIMEFIDVKRLCRRLMVGLTEEHLESLFKQVDDQNRGYLDFDAFCRFTRLLKNRPEINRLYKKLRAKSGGVFDFETFERFMRETQQSSLSRMELQTLFTRYSTSTSTSPCSFSVNDAPALTQTQAQSSRLMTLVDFRSFLLSSDNAAFPSPDDMAVYHDMSHPLPDYFISSSHNTYLVGHQLVGVSTTEGYIRALLCGCRSVELDIYADPVSSPEPMITHGGTLTSKIPLRDVCAAIKQYGFNVSPYPIIISAEMHCSYAGQEEVVKILKEVFGDMLIRRNGAEPEKLDKLPSPEVLRGKILFKTKNLNLSRRESASVEVEPITSASASESEAWVMVGPGASPGADPSAWQSGRRWSSGAKLLDVDAVKEFKDDLLKASSTVFRRVRSVGRSHSRSPRLQSRQLSTNPTPEGPSNAGSPSKGTVPLPSGSMSHSASTLGPSFPQTPHISPEAPAGTTSLPVVPVPGELTAPAKSVALPPSTLSAPPLGSQEIARKTKTRKMSPALLDIMVYTVGVKFRGVNKKEVYAPEHMFSLSETVANSLVRAQGVSALEYREREREKEKERDKQSSGAENGKGNGNGNVKFEEVVQGRKSRMYDLIKHSRTHLVRVYPKGTRVNSTNYEPHRFWAAGVQLVALNWQTCDRGYLINHAMFQRNNRAGYVLKPVALRSTTLNAKEMLAMRTQHYLYVTVVSAQRLPRPRDLSTDTAGVDPFVEVSIDVPDWPDLGNSGAPPNSNEESRAIRPSPSSPPLPSLASPRTTSFRTNVVKNNGFNPVWEENLRIPFDCVGGMMDLVFVRFSVMQGGKSEDEEPLGTFCASLGSLGRGYRHLPLHDAQLSQDLFAALFVKINVLEA